MCHLLFCFTYIHLTATKGSIHLKSRLTRVATVDSLPRELNLTGMKEHIFLFTSAAAGIMQGSSKEVSTLVADRAYKYKQTAADAAT